MDWPSQLAALQELDRNEAFTELAAALAQLSDPPATAHGDLAYWQGKCALLEGHHRTASACLSQCVALQPQRGHAHYLLAVALARQGQWLDAASASRRALELQPELLAAALERAQALLALGDAAGAREALAPFGLADPDLHSLRWQASLREAPLEAGPALIRRALAEPLRLRDGVLREWLEIATGLLLAGEIRTSAAWFEALGTPTPAVAACGHPLPRRPALLLALVAELLEPGVAAPDLGPRLRSCFWLPPADAEQQLWQPLIQPALQLLIGRLRSGLSAPHHHLSLLAEAIHPLEPPDGTEAVAVAAQLTQLCHAPSASLSAAETLLEASADLPRLLELWPSVLACSQAELLRWRGPLDKALMQLSELVLDRPNRLVVHPSPEAQVMALQLREQSLALLLTANQHLASLLPPLPLHQRPRHHWLLLASDDLPQCFLYRVEQKRQQLEALGCCCRIVLLDDLDHWAWSEQLLWADALIVCRLPAVHAVLRAIHSARNAGLPVLYDVDDLIVDPEHCPPPLASYAGTLSPERHRRFHLDVLPFAAALRACDGLIASTATLARRWQDLQAPGDQPVWVLPNLAPPELRRAKQQPQPIHAGTPLRLVVASGTTAHKQAWQEELAPALAMLLERHPQLQLDLLGHLQLPLCLQPFAARIRCRPFTDYPRYLQQLGQAQIGLVVLEPGCFTDAKSAIRWMEFSGLGLASVLSPTATYQEILKPEVHALFARGCRAWVEQIERLIADPALRLQLAQQAQAHAERLFGAHQAAPFWQRMIEPHPQPEPPLRRRKLLVAHVFYAPQLMGGATRVVLDQVRALQQQAGHAWDITLLCSDHTPWQHGEAEAAEPWLEQTPIPLQVHGWEGVRVVRLGLAPRPWREHHDASVEQLCRWWLAQESFDIIHAHCLQVLSAAPLQVAAQLGIPYAITLHDGWWLSPRQFLITASGAPVNPANPLSHYDDPTSQKPSLLERDRVRHHALEHLLQGAAARWAVSEAFAALHRQAGIQDVQVMANRWQPMAVSAPRARRPTELPLRVCFVGGLSLHKGLAVLQAALLQAKLPDPGLQLTLVDAALQTDDGYALVWGDTPVQVVPAVAMDAMASFYAEQDVLVAPSIWPESFGLVTREALSAGLWVVASACGALAEPIRHGQNGHVVPPGDADALAAVLEELCRDHPTPQPLLAFPGSDQGLGVELNRAYRQLLGLSPE